jgi:hypothetical protein
MRRPLRQAIDTLDRLIAELPPDRATAAFPPTFGPALAPGAAPPSPPGPATADLAEPLKAARLRLVQLEQGRGAAEAGLASLQAAMRRADEPARQMARELAEQRAGLGAMYAELASDVAKADPARARRLLGTAVRLDPGNRTRYEKQLTGFDPGGRLPPSAPPAFSPPVASPLDGDPR